MKILVAEDDVLIASKLCNVLQYKEYEIIGPARKGAEAIALYEQHEPDLAVLDWELLDEITGLEVAKRINQIQPIPIIFITGRLDEQTKQEAIAQNACAFLNKPFNDRNLLNAIDLAISQFAQNQLRQETEATEPDTAYKLNDDIFVKKNGKFTKLKIEEILFIEASRHYVIFHTPKEQILANANLSAMLQQVNHPSLVRVHRSYAINITQLEGFDDTFIYFGNKSVPLSKTYKDTFMKSLRVL